MKDFSYYYNLFENMLDLYEFDLALDKENYWRVVDRQSANLGGIEQEQFNTLADILDRMEAYHNDYIIEDLEKCFPEIEYSNWEDLYKELISLSNDEDLSEFEFDIRVLEMILYGVEILSNKKDNEEMKMWWRQNNE